MNKHVECSYKQQIAIYKSYYYITNNKINDEIDLIIVLSLQYDHFLSNHLTCQKKSNNIWNDVNENFTEQQDIWMHEHKFEVNI